MKKHILTMAIIGVAACFAGTAASAATARDKLVQTIAEEQDGAEKMILQKWMANDRGKEFEILLSEYVTREVRYRAMTGKDEKTSLLAAVNADDDNKVTSSTELGRLLVLEYFKRKGVDLKNKRFIKGTYTIGVNEYPVEINLDAKPE